MADSVVQSADVSAAMEKASRLAEGIKSISDPLADPNNHFERNSGAYGSLLEGTAFLGEVSAYLVDKVPGFKGFADAHGIATEFASGVGEDIAGDHDKASEKYVDGMARTVGGDYGGVAVELKETVQNIVEGDFREAAEHLGGAFSELGGALADSASSVLKATGIISSPYVDAVALGAKGTNLAADMVEWVGEDATRAALWEHVEAFRLEKLQSMTEKYWAARDELKAMGVTLDTPAWVKPSDFWDEKRVSAGLSGGDETTASDAPSAHSAKSFIAREPDGHAWEGHDKVESGDSAARFGTTLHNSIFPETPLPIVGGDVVADTIENLGGGQSLKEAWTYAAQENSGITDSPATEGSPVTTSDAEPTADQMNAETIENPLDAELVGGDLTKADLTEAELGDGDATQTEDEATLAEDTLPDSATLADSDLSLAEAGESEVPDSTEYEADDSPSVLDRIVGDDGELSLFEAAYADGRDGTDIPAAELETAEILGVETGSVSADSGYGDVGTADSDESGGGAEVGSGYWGVDAGAAAGSGDSSLAGSDASTAAPSGDWGVGAGSGSSGGSDNSSSSDSGGGASSSPAADSGTSSSGSVGGSGDSGGGDSGGGDSGGGDSGGVGTAV